MRSARALLIVAVTLSAASTARAAPTVQQCIDANESALKQSEGHKLGPARADFLTCASKSCPGEISAECSRKVEEIDAAMPTLVIEAKDSKGNDLVDVQITIDNAALAPRLDGTAIAIDPGPHEFKFTTQGMRDITRTLVLHEGEKARHERIIFTSATDSVTPTGGNGTSRRVIGIVLAVVGLVGVGVGTGLGLSAWSSKNSSESECASPTNCNNAKAANVDHDAAVLTAAGATTSFITAGVLLAVGGTLFFTAPSVTVTNKSGALSFGGTF